MQFLRNVLLAFSSTALCLRRWHVSALSHRDYHILSRMCLVSGFSETFSSCCHLNAKSVRCGLVLCGQIQ